MSADIPWGDADLLQAVREGDAAAYERLHERHAGAARALARQLVRGEAEVEDVLAEAFTRILDLVGRGGGPESGFRTYLLTVVRRTVYDRTRVESPHVATGESGRFDPGVPFVDPALVGLERSPVARAFLTLPERWRAVLWHTEVEGATPAEVAPLLGLSAGGVSALAYRAREGLRQACLQLRLSAAPRQECRPVLRKMGVHVRGGLPRREAHAVDEHVRGCAECRSVLLELTDIDRGLRVIVGPLVVGPAFAGYLAELGSPGSDGGRLRQKEGGRVRLLRRSRPGVRGDHRALGWLRRLSRPGVGGSPLRRVRRPGADGSPLRRVRRPGVGGSPLRRVSRQRLAAVAGGLAATVAVGAAFLLVLTEEPVPPPAAHVPLAASFQSEPSGPPDEPTLVRPQPAPTVHESAGVVRLRATIDALGTLVRDQSGVVGLRLRNTGSRPSKDLRAKVDLPPGVTMSPPAGKGQGFAPAGGAGAADGWSCRPAGYGANCVRGPLGAGRSTATFLRVRVAADAPEGLSPAVRVASGQVRIRARAVAGVRPTGAAARFATEGRVVVKAIGNALLTCPDESEGCAEARRRVGDSRDNDQWPMVPLDQDTVASTTASSGATLDLPRGSRIGWAGLYWSAGVETAGPIRFRPPGRKRYLSITPTQVLTRALPSGPAYQAFADVTGLVSSTHGSGTWWAADPPMATGVSQHAGWSLVVILADPALPYSQAVVLDAATVVGGEAGTARIPLDGLSASASSARVELVTWEGDADLGGDTVSLGSGPLTPASGGRDPANVFDGSSNGVRGMTFGMDVDTFGAPLGSDPGLLITTEDDVVLFGVAAVSVPARS
ncbi:sigma-70 family RNA polymerase sigma factor [Nonomuraea sp. NPDC000554]|uniref:sigma-70 family RNA polymerase sigma factor n=1 Tax=Nonomuraea sp. NPDC000554 TaxID=3154259 RepID=UPI00332B3579